MTQPEERLVRYHRRREARLRTVPGLRSGVGRGGSMVYYRADELLVVDDERTRVERYLTRQGRAVSRKGDESVGFGVRRYVVTGLDVAEAIRAVREETPAGAQVVAPNHIFLSTPYNHGGPFGPPVPVPASHLRPRLPVPAPVPVA